MTKKISSSFLVFLSTVILICSAYVYDFYRASNEALSLINEESYVEVESNEMIVFPAENASTGIIFYPGGKVQCEAYAPLMSLCAKENIFCVIVRMPGNLAVLNMDAAKGIQNHFPEINKWYLAGHSLGGSMAASYVKKTEEVYDGIILLASYSTADLSKLNIEALSMYGSEDKVLDMEKYEECSSNLPKKYTEFIIEGGSHAYFGSYGEQEGDGEALISQNEQLEIAAKQIVEFVK